MSEEIKEMNPDDKNHKKNAKFSGNGYDESWQYGFRATE